jgi:two-component system sensor histidine kinase BaeS
LGPLGRRLLVAFVVVALTSVVVLTVASLIGTSQGLTAGEDARRQTAAVDAAKAAASAYRDAGGWAGANLIAAQGIASNAGAGLVVRDGSDVVVTAAPEMMAGTGQGAGLGNGQGSGRQGSGQGNGQQGTGMMQGGGMMGSGRGGIVEPVVVDGLTVGSVRLGFGSPSTATAQNIAWTWIIVAALVSLAVAIVMALYVSRRISRPLARLSSVARSFAAGDRAARADPADASAPGELGEIARSFDASADEVVRSEQARQRMAADVAHELRTPLAALQAGLEELRDGLVEPEPARLAALHAQSVRLGRVVDDLSHLSAAESAALTLRRQRVDLGLLVTEAVSASRPSLDAAGISVTVDVPAGIAVNGDADRLHQAFGNVLANAARHCRAGDSVAVGVAADRSRALVTIADTGPGIAPEDLPYVFDRLWRGSADSDAAGSGIGLAVVRELVVAHGGTVEATSDGMSGTTFVLSLPRQG